MVRIGKITLLILLVLCSTEAIHAEEWNRTFGSEGNDHFSSILQSPDGGYIIAGSTDSYGAGEDDIWLVKTDAMGYELWNRTYGGPDWEQAYSICHTSNSGYIIAGSTFSSEIGSRILLIKIDENGNKEWENSLEGNRANSIQQTTDGGYIIAGEGLNEMETVIWIARTDDSGNEQWNRTLKGVKHDSAYSVRQTTDNGYIVAGERYLYQGPIACLIKYNVSGDQQWVRTFPGKSCPDRPGYASTQASAVLQTADGGYILTGYLISYTDCKGEVITSNSDILLIKTDENGNEQWNQTFGEEYDDGAVSVLMPLEGGYILAGWKGVLRGETISWLIKTDDNGNELWNRTFEGIDNNRANAVLLTGEGHYIMAGDTYSRKTNNRDVFLKKIENKTIITVPLDPANSIKPQIYPTEDIRGFEIITAAVIFLAINLLLKKHK